MARAAGKALWFRGGIVACLALAGCPHGGGGSSPDISISFAISATALPEDATSVSVQVVLHTVFPELVDPVSVDVFDAGTGTAASGSDYAAFATQTIVFPSGSTDGAVAT